MDLSGKKMEKVETYTIIYVWIIKDVEEETIETTLGVHLDFFLIDWWEEVRKENHSELAKNCDGREWKFLRTWCISSQPWSRLVWLVAAGYSPNCFYCSMNTSGRSIPYSMTFTAALLTCMSLRCKQARIMLKRGDNARHKSFCRSSGFVVFMSWERLQVNLCLVYIISSC